MHSSREQYLLSVNPQGDSAEQESTKLPASQPKDDVPAQVERVSQHNPTHQAETIAAKIKMPRRHGKRKYGIIIPVVERPPTKLSKMTRRRKDFIDRRIWGKSGGLRKRKELAEKILAARKEQAGKAAEKAGVLVRLKDLMQEAKERPAIEERERSEKRLLVFGKLEEMMQETKVRL
ncbi:hypothetical protein LZ554_009224 [Drepanopeziza brunnea f. sp. 'monogermtubi']|nr:hypothetical protein LZ554_009224 [Drepanopeziza brunnea f. sp. 'monogermtubi']